MNQHFDQYHGIQFLEWMAHVTKSVMENVNRELNDLMFRWIQIIFKMKREKIKFEHWTRLIHNEYFVRFKVSCFIIILMKCCSIHCAVSLRKRLAHLNVIHSSIRGFGSCHGLFVRYRECLYYRDSSQTLRWNRFHWAAHR